MFVDFLIVCTICLIVSKLKKFSLNSIEYNEKRRLHRIENNSFMGLSAVALSSENEMINCKIVDYNSLGFRLSFENFSDYVKVRDFSVSIKIFYGKNIITEINNFNITFYDKKELVVCIEITNPRVTNILRKYSRIDVNKGFRPMIMADDLFNLGTLLHFDVLDYSAHGAKLCTSMSNKHLIVGQNINDGNIVFPGIGISKLNFKIIAINVVNNKLIINVSFYSMDEELKMNLARFSGIGIDSSKVGSMTSLHNLSKNADLITNKYKSGIWVRPIDNEDDYRQVVEVRRLAYSKRNKKLFNKNVADKDDGFDVCSIILAAKFSGKVIGTFRILPLNNVSKTSKHKLHDILSEKQLKRSCEVSKLAILPEFQRTDVLISLFRRCFEYSQKAGLKDVYCMTNESNLKLYYRLGATLVRANLSTCEKTGQKISLVLLNCDTFIKGQNMTAHAWVIVAKDTAKHLSDFGFVSVKVFTPWIYLKLYFEKIILFLRNLFK